LHLRQKLLGKKHPHFASSLNNLALLYNSQGRYSEAESLYLQHCNYGNKYLVSAILLLQLISTILQFYTNYKEDMEKQNLFIAKPSN
jgi:hypothetical protein